MQSPTGVGLECTRAYARSGRTVARPGRWEHLPQAAMMQKGVTLPSLVKTVEHEYTNHGPHRTFMSSLKPKGSQIHITKEVTKN